MKSLKHTKWIYIFGGATLLYIALIYWIRSHPPADTSWLYPLVNNFGGNLTASILCALLFLLLSFYIGARAEEQIGGIYSHTEQRMQQLEHESLITQFENFMKKESYHNVRFPDIKTAPDSLGLEYTIFPVRNPKDGEPIKKNTEMDSCYIVRLTIPRYFRRMEPETQKAYDTSPIQDNEYYFCQFYNGSWHMGSEDVGRDWHKFYMSGKVGPVQVGQSANKFVNTRCDLIKNRKEIANLFLDDNGMPPIFKNGIAVGSSYRIYVDEDGNSFLQIHDSPLKPVYLTNPPETRGDAGWFLAIEHLHGYGDDQKLKNIIQAISAKLDDLKINIKKVPWHQVVDKELSIDVG